MRAAVVTEFGKLEWQDRPEPQPAPGHALIRPLTVGICGTDVHGFRGDNPFLRLPRVFGHEIVAEVLQVAEESSQLQSGKTVVVNPMITCGRCRPCRIGRRNCCVRMQVVGVHVDGGFQERLALPVSMLHPWPSTLPVWLGALCEPLSIGLQAVRRGQVEPGDRVVILGAGPIGLAVLLMAKRVGAQVLITDRYPRRLHTAMQLGANEIVDVAQRSAKEAVDRFTDGEGASVVIEATGVPAAIEASVDLVAAAGRVVVLGITTEKVTFAARVFVQKEIDFRGSRLNADLFPEVIHLLASGNVDPRPMVSHRLPFSDLATAFDLAETKPDQTLKILIDLEG